MSELTPFPKPGHSPNWGRQLIRAIEDRDANTIPLARDAGRSAAVQALSDQPEVTDAAATRAVTVAADPAIAGAVTTPGTQTSTALETAFGPAPAAEEKIVFVSARGNDSNDGSNLKRAKATLAAAVNAVGDASTRIELGAGTFDMGPDVHIRSQVSVIGQGSQTVLNYTGTGTAIGATTPDSRTYRPSFRNLRLVGPGKTIAGTVGLDLASMSEFVIEDVTVVGFETGIRVRSSVNTGGASYGRMWNVTVQQCATGISAERGANALTIVASRASSCDAGIRITDANNITVLASQIETNGVGIEVNATANGMSDKFVAALCRFETNSTDWALTSANVRYARILDPLTFGTYTFDDQGLSTTHTGYQSGYSKWRSHTNDPGGAWVFERTQHGGTYAPAFVVRDTNTSSGLPVTHQVETGRASGVFYRGVRAGSVFFEVNGYGAVGTGANATAQRPPSSTVRPGSLWYDTTLGKPIWWNGTAWTDAMGTVV